MITVSLETARKLKEAGWTKPTKLVWVDNEEWGIHVELWDGHAPNDMICYVPTTDEILADLPDEIFHKKWFYIKIYSVGKHWVCGYYAKNMVLNEKRNPHLAEAVAELWLWAKAKDYIKQEAQG